MTLTHDEKVHLHGCQDLAMRLLSTRRYDVVLMGPTYHVGQLVGELDVMAIRGDTCHYYEVKCRKTRTNFRHAIEQVHRVQAAFPGYKIKGVYVPLNGGVRRIRHG